MIRVKDSRFEKDGSYLETLIGAAPIKPVVDVKTGQPNGNYMTGPVRLSWTQNLFKAKANDAGKEVYGVTLLFPAGIDITPLMQAVQQSAAATFPDRVSPQGFQWAGIAAPFHLQDEKSSKYSGYLPGANALYVNVSTYFKPVIVDARNNPIVDEKRVYPGVWALAAVSPYAYNNKKKGVSLGLQSLMIVADDNNIGQGKGGNPAQDFAGINITADTSVVAAFTQAAGSMPMPGMQSDADIMRSMGLPV